MLPLLSLSTALNKALVLTLAKFVFLWNLVSDGGNRSCYQNLIVSSRSIVLESSTSIALKILLTFVLSFFDNNLSSVSLTAAQSATNWWSSSRFVLSFSCQTHLTRYWIAYNVLLACNTTWFSISPNIRLWSVLRISRNASCQRSNFNSLSSKSGPSRSDRRSAERVSLL